LKGEGDSVYGPADLSELWDWAAQCRIGPSHEVSQDKESWTEAKDVPELRMEWVCTLPDGETVGPLNPFAFRELVSDGQLSPERAVLNRVTGETISVGELLKAAEPIAASLRKPPEPEAQTWERRCAEAEARSQRIAEELAQKERLLAAEQDRRAQLERELATEREARAGLSAHPHEPKPAKEEDLPIPPKRLRERVLAASKEAQRAKEPKREG
jgi:hypothetical protein